MTDTLTLPEDLQAKIADRIASGAAQDAVEVVRAGLEALEKAEATKLEVLRVRIARALDDPRPSVPSDGAFDRVEAILQAMLRA